MLLLASIRRFFSPHLLCRCCQQFDIKSLLFLRYQFSTIYQAVHKKNGKHASVCRFIPITSFQLGKCNRCCQQFDIKSLLFLRYQFSIFYTIYHAVHKKLKVEEQGRRKQSKFGWAYSMRLKATMLFCIHLSNQKLKENFKRKLSYSQFFQITNENILSYSSLGY